MTSVLLSATVGEQNGDGELQDLLKMAKRLVAKLVLPLRGLPVMVNTILHVSMSVRLKSVNIMPQQNCRTKNAVKKKSQTVEALLRKNDNLVAKAKAGSSNNDPRSSEILASITRSTEGLKADSKGISNQLSGIQEEIETLKSKIQYIEHTLEFQETENKRRFESTETRADLVGFHQLKYNLIFRGLKAEEWP